jgi:hypothetical protein
MLEAMGGHNARLAAPGRRPAKLPNDLANAALVAHLQTVGDVSTFGPSPDGKTIKVNMKCQWPAADTSGSSDVPTCRLSRRGISEAATNGSASQAEGELSLAGRRFK